MICEKCGQWIENGSKACSKCGAPVGVNNAQGANTPTGSAGNTMAAGNAAPGGGQPGMGGFNAGAGAGQPGTGGYNAGAAMGQPGAGGYYANGMQGGQPLMTKEEFSKHPNIAPVRSQIRSAGIVCYIVAGITLVMSVLAGGIWGIIGVIFDVMLLVGLGLGIQLGRSRVCAIILTVYGVFNTIVVTLQNEALGGWWVLLAGIYAIIYTFKYQGAWAEYLKTGIVKDFSQGKKK